jgi:amidase
MGFAEYSNYDGLGLAELVKKKKVKAAELVEAAIEHIERHNAQLNFAPRMTFKSIGTPAKAPESFAVAFARASSYAL